MKTILPLTARERFGLGLIVLTGLLAFQMWRVFFVTIAVPGVPEVWKVVLWFLALMVVFQCGLVLWPKTLYQVVGITLFFLTALLFRSTILLGILVVCASGLTYAAMRAMQNDIAERLDFRFYKSARIGQFPIVFAVALVLSGAYFTTLRQESWEELVPRFHLGQGSSAVIFKVAGIVSPDLRRIVDERTTVDQFLESIATHPANVSESALSPAYFSGGTLTGIAMPSGNVALGKDRLTGVEAGVAREALLRSGRDQLSTLVGRSVGGEEQIADVFADGLQAKMIAFLNGGVVAEHTSPRIVPYVLSLLLFVTLLSVGAIVGPFWIVLAEGLYGLARAFGWVKIVRVPREQEALEA